LQEEEEGGLWWSCKLTRNRSSGSGKLLVGRRDCWWFQCNCNSFVSWKSESGNGGVHIKDAISFTCTTLTVILPCD
jgi:hypothetical protein